MAMIVDLKGVSPQISLFYGLRFSFAKVRALGANRLFIYEFDSMSLELKLVRKLLMRMKSEFCVYAPPWPDSDRKKRTKGIPKIVITFVKRATVPLMVAAPWFEKKIFMIL